MKPYYDEDGITIYHADCVDVFPLVEPASVSLLLTDPPYGVGHRIEAMGTGNAGKFENVTIVADDTPFDPRPLLAWGRCVIFGANYFAHLLPPGGWVVWSKAQDNRFAFGRSSTRSLAEVAWTNCHRYVALYNCFWAGSPLFRVGEERGLQLHPTQKPVELMRWLINRLTEPGELIFDPYMGSGPIAQACRDLGRRYIGVEIVEDYCKVAVDRLLQGVLAFEP